MNITEIKKNFNKLGIEIKIFFIFTLLADKKGRIRAEKKELQKYLKVSIQTIGKYIRTFVECNMMKYKYSGEAMFNPDFYYTGEESQRASIQEEYKAFKSDITF